jgi:heme exporter protein B
VLAVIWKDIVLEARSRETLASLLVFGLVVLVVFNFALDVTPANVLELAPGLLWIAIVLSAVTGVGRTFMIERENGCMTGLLLAPIDRSAVFLAKLTVNLLLLFTFEIALLPCFVVIYSVPVSGNLGTLCAVVVAGTVGLAAAGTLFATAALGSRARELMLPLIVLPLQIPLLIAAVQATELALSGASLASLGSWGTILVAFDVLFVTMGWLAFEFLTVD